MIYSIVSYLTLRKEWFGILISNPRTGDFHQFDKDSLSLLEVLQKPICFDQIKKEVLKKGFEIGNEELQMFLDDLLLHDILTTDISNIGNKILFLNEEVPENYLVSPSSVTIYITQYCGKACRHCVTESHSNIDQSSEYDLHKWKEILLNLKRIGVMGIVFTGGEPLSKNDIFEILSFADSLDFRISLLTDLDGIDISVVQKLKELKNLLDIQTSLDGATADSHDFIRGKGSFEKTLERLEVFSSSGIEYTISCSINSMNIVEIDEIADISKKYNASYLYLNPVAPYGRAKLAMKDYLLDDKQLYDLAHKYLDIIENKNIDPGNPYWSYHANDKGSLDFHPFEKALDALSLGVYNFSIGQKGECYLDSKMKAEKILYLGNAIDDSLPEMWNSQKLDFLREASSSGEIFIDITEI